MVLIDAVVDSFSVSMTGSPDREACSGSTGQIGDQSWGGLFSNYQEI